MSDDTPPALTVKLDPDSMMVEIAVADDNETVTLTFTRKQFRLFKDKMDHAEARFREIEARRAN